MLKIANHSHYFKAPARELVERAQDVSVPGDFLLHIDDEQIRLCTSIQQQKTCFTHTLTDPKLARRARQGNQALLKACNNKKKDINTVVDLTAGWGKDSLILAMQGQSVTMVEQHALIHACMDYLLKIAQQASNDPAFQRLTISSGNSLQLFDGLKDKSIDCFYLDPMFPAHKSTARPGKDLQLLQLLTTNTDIKEIFSRALQCAAHRVVVKRPLHAPCLDDRKPDIVYKEKTIRFDVYLTKR